MGHIAVILGEATPSVPGYHNLEHNIVNAAIGAYPGSIRHKM